MVLDGCVASDCATGAADAVANLPGVQRLLRRWKADALKISDLPEQGAVSTTCRHLPAEDHESALGKLVVC